ncbi:Transposase, IS4 (plasmid) [Deinococcus gobiensis I-0]|uniref:Transposase, IS4 n=2 Tax=Deinococcus TaxID=1298 RepID=H8H261_DEIGI|nr:Transposase, IS4 [Deinococcus gobiensis I-0]
MAVILVACLVLWL